MSRIAGLLEALGPGWVYNGRKQAFLGPGTMFVRQMGKKQRLNYRYSFFNNYKHVSNHRELYKLLEAIDKVVKDEGLIIPPASKPTTTRSASTPLQNMKPKQLGTSKLAPSSLPTDNRKTLAELPKISDETKEKVRVALAESIKNRNRITI